MNLNRRELLKVSAGCIGAAMTGGGLTIGASAASPPAVGPASPPFRLRYVLASSLYEKESSIEQVVPEIRRAGMEALDVWGQGWVPHRDQIEKMGHDKFADLLKANNARLASFSCYRLGPMGVKSELGTIKKLGGDLAICGASKGSGDLKAAVKQFVEKVQPTVEEAEKTGVTVGIENHGGDLLATADGIRYFVEFAGSERLALVYAPYHLPQDPRVQADLIRQVGHKIAHIYLWQRGAGTAQLPGVGAMDFVPILAALKAVHYKGWSEIFMHGKVAPTAGEVTATIAKARRYVEDCLVKA